MAQGVRDDDDHQRGQAEVHEAPGQAGRHRQHQQGVAEARHALREVGGHAAGRGRHQAGQVRRLDRQAVPPPPQVRRAHARRREDAERRPVAQPAQLPDGLVHALVLEVGNVLQEDHFQAVRKLGRQAEDVPDQAGPLPSMPTACACTAELASWQGKPAVSTAGGSGRSAARSVRTSSNTGPPGSRPEACRARSTACEAGEASQYATVRHTLPEAPHCASCPSGRRIARRVHRGAALRVVNYIVLLYAMPSTVQDNFLTIFNSVSKSKFKTVQSIMKRVENQPDNPVNTKLDQAMDVAVNIFLVGQGFRNAATVGPIPAKWDASHLGVHAKHYSSSTYIIANKSALTHDEFDDLCKNYADKDIAADGKAAVEMGKQLGYLQPYSDGVADGFVSVQLWLPIHARGERRTLRTNYGPQGVRTKSSLVPALSKMQGKLEALLKRVHGDFNVEVLLGFHGR